MILCWCSVCQGSELNHLKSLIVRVTSSVFDKSRSYSYKRSVQGLCSRYPNCLVDLCRYCATVDCNERCLEFEPILCPKLKRPPYVCNSCEGFRKCLELKQVYDARLAEKTYRTTLSESRAGIARLYFLDTFITMSNLLCIESPHFLRPLQTS
jgi:hypothetical protein